MEYIYIITSPENRHFQKYKIGRTTNPEKKDLLRRYHTSLPQVEILEFIPVLNSKTVEENIHKLLSDYRISGSEWFQGDLFLFKQTTYAECFRNKQVDLEKNVINKLFDWFQEYYDPHQTFDILEEFPNKMKLHIGSERFLCPISNEVHVQHRYHAIKLDFDGNCYFSCSVCEKKRNLGNVGFKPVFYKHEEKFEPSEKVKSISEKIKLFDAKPQKMGYMHVKTDKVYDVENDLVYDKSSILFHLEDDMNKRMKWLAFQKKHDLFQFECVSCKDKVELNCLTGECFSYNECVKFEFKDEKIICLDCGHVQTFEEEFDLLEKVEKFMEKYQVKFVRKQDKYFVFEKCVCPIHKEEHELVVFVTNEGSVELKCLAENKIMNFVFPKIGELDYCFVNGKWVYVYENYNKDEYKKYCAWMKNNTRRKPISQIDFTKKINLAIK